MKIDINKLNEIATRNPNYWDEAKRRSKNRKVQYWSSEISLRVMDYMEEKSLNKRQMAKKLEMSPQQFGRILSGNANFTIATVARLEEATGMRLLEVPKRAKTPEPRGATYFSFNEYSVFIERKISNFLSVSSKNWILKSSESVPQNTSTCIGSKYMIGVTNPENVAYSA